MQSCAVSRQEHPAVGTRTVDHDVNARTYNSKVNSSESRLKKGTTAGRIRSAVSYIVSLTQSGIRKDYDILSDQLGKGKYGVVRRAIQRKTGMHCAIKVLPKVNEAGKNEIIFALREIEIMSKISHPNCVEYYGKLQHRSQGFIF